MHVKRHLSRLFGSFRLKGKVGGGPSHTVMCEEVEEDEEWKENRLSRSKSLREKVSSQLSTISTGREKNKSSSRWQLLDAELEVSNPEEYKYWDKDNSGDNLLNGQLQVPVLVEVCQEPKASPTNTSSPFLMEDDLSLRVHSASRSGHKHLEGSRAAERVLLDSYLDYDYISNWYSTNSTQTNSPTGIRTCGDTAGTLSKCNGMVCCKEEDGHGHCHDEEDDYLHQLQVYDLQKSADKKEKKSWKLYRYASLRFRSFNKKKSKIVRTASLRSLRSLPKEEPKSIDSKTRNRRVKLQKVKQQEVLDIIKPSHSKTGTTTTATTTANPAKIHHYEIHNGGVRKGFVQRRLSIKALKKSGSGMGKMLKGGFAAVARTMIFASHVTPHPYECPASSANYDSYWGNDYHDHSTYKDYHYQLEYNRRRYSASSHTSLSFQKQMNHDY